MHESFNLAARVYECNKDPHRCLDEFIVAGAGDVGDDETEMADR